MARKSRKNLPQPEQAAASVLLPELEEAKMPAAIYGRLSVEDEETEESMLIGGFVIFMVPQVVGSVVVLLELAVVMLRQVWYI